MKRTAGWLAAVGVVSLIGCLEVGDAGQRDLDGESPEDGADILYQATPTPAKVGMFYLLWHCFSLDRRNPPYSIAEGIATGNWGPIPEFHWWGQPAGGYYCLKNLGDPAVRARLESHATLLRDAGVDFVFVDFTNQNWTEYPGGDISLEQSFQNLLAVWSGVPGAPKVVPWVPACMSCRRDTNADGRIDGADAVVPGNMLEWVVQTMASYPSLVFYYEGKPLLLLVNNLWFPLDPGKKAWAQSFATVREMWAVLGRGNDSDTWSFMEECQDTLAFKNSGGTTRCNQRVTSRNGQVEQVPIATAYQYGVMSRTAGTQLLPASSVPKFAGRTFQQQAYRLLDYPEARIATIAGWNEWMAQRSACAPEWPASECSGDQFPNGNKIFIDAYDPEYNRDIECGGPRGCFYYDLMRQYVRAYKGLP